MNPTITRSYWDVMWKTVNENRIFLFSVFFGIFIWSLAPVFLSQLNLRNVAKDVAVPGMVACGVLMLMVSRHFDLSVGSAVALSGAISAQLSVNGFPLPVILPIILLFGASIGLANAVVVRGFKVNSLVATLSMMFILDGIILLYTKEHTIFGMSKSYLWLGQGSIGPLPVSLFFLVFVAVLSYLVLHRSLLGRHLYIIGANPQSAFLSGIKTNFSVAVIYVYVGVISGFAGVVYAAQYSAASPLAGRGMELRVIAAIVAGGANLYGGTGRVARTMAGVVLMEMIFNGLTLLNVDPNYSLIVQGLIIATAVAYDVLSKKIRGQ